MIYLLSLVGGLIVWSLAEYLVHRFVLHGIFSRYHSIHHKDALDGNGLSYSNAVLISGVTLTLAHYALGIYATVFVIGLLLGYVTYVTAHETMHRLPWLLLSDSARHNIHHRVWRYNYGVTTPFWDHVFRTYKRT